MTNLSHFQYWCTDSEKEIDKGYPVGVMHPFSGTEVQIICSSPAHEVALIVKNCRACGKSHRFELPVKNVTVL